MGLADGRYLRREDGEPSEVLVCTTLGAAPSRGRRRARTRGVDPEPTPESLPLTRLTVVATRDLGGAENAERWLRGLDRDPEAAAAFADGALRTVNRALRAQAAAARDAYVRELSASAAVATRIGYGEGEQVADGRWTDARELERAEPRRRRGAPEESQERVAAVLGGHEDLAASETLLLRARLDLDQGAVREAALQLRAAVDALVREAAETAAGSEEIEDVRRRAAELERAAAAAARGDLEPDRAEWLGETLGLCERLVVRRQRRLSTST